MVLLLWLLIGATAGADTPPAEPTPAPLAVVVAGFPPAPGSRVDADPCLPAHRLLAELEARATPVTLMVRGSRGERCHEAVREAADAGFALGHEGWTGLAGADATTLVADLVRGEDLLAPVLVARGLPPPALLLPGDVAGWPFATREMVRAFVSARNQKPVRADLDLRLEDLDGDYLAAGPVGRTETARAWRDDLVSRAVAAARGGGLAPVLVVPAGPLSVDHLPAALDAMEDAGLVLRPLDAVLGDPARAARDPYAPDWPAVSTPQLPDSADAATLSAWLSREPAGAAAAFEALLRAGEEAIPVLLEGALDHAPFRAGILEPAPGRRPPVGLARLYLVDAALRGCRRPAERLALSDRRREEPEEAWEPRTERDGAEKDGGPPADRAAEDAVARLVGRAEDGRPVRVVFRDLGSLSESTDDRHPAPEEAPGPSAPAPDAPETWPSGIPDQEAWETAVAAYRAYWERYRLEPREMTRLRPHPLAGSGVAWAEPNLVCGPAGAP